MSSEQTALAKLAAIARSGPPAEREAAELILTALLHRVTFGS